MPTGFIALSNDGIAPLVFQPSRLVHGGGRRDDLCAGRPDALKQGSFGQAEVKADDLRSELLHKITPGAIERRAGRSGNRRLWVKSEFDVVAFQTLLPGVLTRWVSLWRLMAEEIEVDGPGGPLTDDPKLGPHLLRAEHRAGQGAEPSCLGDGDTISDPTEPAIGAWMIGNSMPKRSWMR